MNNVYETTVKAASKDSFSQYGQLFEVPSDKKPTKSGDEWDCWSYLSILNASVEVGVGLVRTEISEYIVDSMERHVSRQEILLPLEKEIIQPVARYKSLNDPDEQPEPESIECFRIKPGQGIIMNKGVWHSPAFPIQGNTTYLFAIENKKDVFGDEIQYPWVSLVNNRKVKFSI